MKQILWVFVLTLSLTPAAIADDNTLPQIMPAPQSIEWTSGQPDFFDTAALKGVAVPVDAQSVQPGIDYLAKALGLTLIADPKGTLTLTLDALPKSIPSRTRAEAYQLIVKPAGITVVAEKPHGLHNGLITLSELSTDKGIPCVTILDWPDQVMRGVYVSGVVEADARFEQFVSLKLNMILVEDGKLFDLENPETLSAYKAFAEKCRSHFIDFVPELQSLGWGMYVLLQEPRCVEARWIDKKPFPVKNGCVYSPDPDIPPAAKVANASFESGMKGWHAETYRDRRWNDSAERDAGVVGEGHSGKALKLVSEGTNTVRIEQDIEVKPNARYEVRCMLKTEDIAGRGALMEVYGVEKSGNFGAFLGGNENPRRGTTGWASHEVMFETSFESPARPGGTFDRETKPRVYERVRIFLRIQDGAGTAWFDDIEVISLQANNSLDNVVVTDTARVIVQSEDKATTYERGKDFTLDVPELRYPFSEGDPLGVTFTADSGVKDGDTVLLSYNQAGREDVTCCPSEPLYRAFMRKTIHDVIRELKPKYLHIGHDEARFFNRDQRCSDQKMSNEELFVDDIKRMHQYALEADPNVRVMMWDDAINPYQNGPSLKTSDAAKYLPKDIIVNVWWYGDSGWEKLMDASMDYFLGLDFDTTGSPWFRIPNAWHWAELLNSLKEHPKTLGVIYTSWATDTPWAALELTAEHAWSFNKPPYTPEP